VLNNANERNEKTHHVEVIVALSLPPFLKPGHPF